MSANALPAFHDPVQGARPSPPRLLLVDDESEFLEVLATWFRSRGFVVRCAPDAVAALIEARREVYQVAITDLRMPGINGLQLLGMLKEMSPQTEVVFLTGHGTMKEAIVALREGRAFDFLEKPLRNMQQISLVVEKALARAQATADGVPPGPATEPAQARPRFSQVIPKALSPLSSREIEIVGLLAEGLGNREISERLHLSEKTIKNHLSRIYDKLQVANRTQAVLVCQRHGLL